MVKAQSNATFYGTVKDDSGNAVQWADVFIEGTPYFVVTNEEGNYEMEVKPGIYEVVIAAMGYMEETQKLTVTERVELSVVLKPENDVTTELDVALITVATNKESEASLLNAQKKSVVISESIGYEELERKGVSHVANALTKVSGISKQEGSNSIHIRGLGDRYNSTTLNGLPIPSNDPEYKNIDLSIFSTGILSHIGIDKVYSNHFYGDFSGGNVNINSKKNNGRSFFSFGMSKSMNSNALSDSNFRLQQGINWFGFSKSKNPKTLDYYGFENSLNPKKEKFLGSGFSLSTGSIFKWGNQRKLSFLFTSSHDNEYSSIQDGLLKSGVNIQGTIQSKDFTSYNLYKYSTNTTGYLNVSLDTDAKNKIDFNSLFINSTDQKLEEGEGYMRDNANEGGMLRRGTYVQNRLWINQLVGKHELTNQLDLNWGIGYNTIQSDMPDRFQNTVEWKSNLNHFVIANSSASLNHRYFQTLDEKEFIGNIYFHYGFQKDENNKNMGKLTFGYSGRIKNRDFEAMQFNLSPNYSNQYVDFNDLDAFYNPSNYEDGAFSISTFSGLGVEPQFYNAKQSIHGGYAMLEYHLAPKLIAVLGVRSEVISQLVEWNTSLDPKGDKNELNDLQFLPNVNLKYEVSNRQNIRFAASKTYTLPQFKERALFMYEDLGETVYGWPTTYASDNFNVDLKWEFFPKTGEIISMAAYGKYIQNPINKFTVSSSTNDISYANTGDWGYVYGAELELRKVIYASDSDQPIQFSMGANVSYLYTQQELNNDKIFEETLLNNGSRLNANFTTDRDKFQGASDLLLNGDISFSKKWKKGSDLNLTLSYNYFSDRIYALGTDGRGNIVEKGIGTLDFILRAKLNKTISFNLKANNLVNPKIERFQEIQTVTVLEFKQGRNFSFGVNYQF